MSGGRTVVRLGMLAGFAVATVVFVEAWVWLVHRRAAVRGFPRSAVESDGVVAVVVLGFRNRGGSANRVNRWRAAAAVRVAERFASVFVVASGGAVAGGRSEAVLLATEMRRRGYRGEVCLEDRSTSTWENVTNSIPLLERADRVVIVSNALHAVRARQYLYRQRPDLAARLVRVPVERWFDLVGVRSVMVFGNTWVATALKLCKRI